MASKRARRLGISWVLCCGLAGGAAAGAPPNIVFMLVDDLGESGVPWNNPHVLGPRLTELMEEGLLLRRHYTYKFCSPTRSSIMTGRYPYRMGNTRSNFIPWSRPDAVQLGFDFFPQRLARLGVGYTSHHVGKWHLGFYNHSFLPTSRGFDSFFGYLAGEQDHFTQELNEWIACPGIVDLTDGDKPAYGKNGTYTGWMYNAKAVAAIDAMAERKRRAEAAGEEAPPFFLNYWMQNTHAPVEVPSQYASLYHFEDKQLQTFYGMISVVDEAAGNVTAALKRGGLWDSTLLVYTQDNGAELGRGGSNYPLRGGKNSNFEGGVRTPAIISGGALPAHKRGRTSEDLFHVADWSPTLLGAIAEALSGSLQGPRLLSDALAGTIPVDGIDQWAVLIGGEADRRPHGRLEVVLDHCLQGFGMYYTGCNHFNSTREGGTGALIVGDWKLVVGPNAGQWSSFTNSTQDECWGGVACEDFCLFNLADDPTEHHDLAASHADVAARLLARFEALGSEYHPPFDNPPDEADAFCSAAAAAGGFLVPWATAASSVREGGAAKSVMWL